MNSRMDDYKFETNGRSVAYHGKLDTGISIAPPAKDQKRAIDNHNIMIENESRLVWKEAYLSYSMIPYCDRPVVHDEGGGTHVMSVKKYADTAAHDYLKTWSKK